MTAVTVRDRESVPLAGPARRRIRWHADDPGWARVGLLLVALTSLLSYAWGIEHSAAFGYYAGAVRTMSGSWHAFLFGGLDQGGLLTVDKLPGAFWVQALAARLFGFSPVTVLGPQVLEGVLTIFVTYRATRRVSGPSAGLIAAAVVAAMPVSTSVSRGNVPDALATLLLVLAADATLRATQTGNRNALSMAGLWVGLAFQAKMVQSWVLLPAIALTYVLGAPGERRDRIRAALVACSTAMLVSVGWIAVLSLVPARHHPWFDGSSDNSILEQVLDYNAFSRVPVSRNTASGASSWSRLDTGHLALEIGWLLPVAFVCAGSVWWSRRGRPRTDPTRAAVRFWSIWLASFGLAFSAITKINAYYPVVLSPAIGALVGTGAVWAWRERRTGLAGRVLVPATLALNSGYAVFLLGSAGPQWAWLTIVIAAFGGLAVLLAAVHALRPAVPALELSVAASATVALLLAPAVGSAALDARGAGAYAWAFSSDSGMPLGTGPSGTFVTRYRERAAQVLDYVEPRAGTSRYLVATAGSDAAAIVTVATGRAVLPIGGYTGAMPTPTLTQLQDLLQTGQVRFVVARPDSTDPRIQWVLRTCPQVPGVQMPDDMRPEMNDLYDCAG